MSQIIKTLIVDDEPLARKGLAVRLLQHDDIKVVAECGNASQALASLAEQQIDLLLLDVQMPGKTGFQLVEEIIKQNITLPIVVFVTAYDQYALKAFEIHALDYLLKPADDERIAQMLDKVRQQRQQQQHINQQHKLLKLVSDVTGTDYQQILADLAEDKVPTASSYSDVLVIKDAGELTRVPIKDILWIDAAGDYMCVHTDKNTHILRETMKNLEQTLDPRQFVRSHRSVIVNKHYIEKFCNQLNGEYYLVLKNGQELKVSRSYKDKVKQAVTQ